MAENTENVVETEEVETVEAVETAEKTEATEKSAKADKAAKADKKAKAKKEKKPSWFKGLKAEFKKIVWPDKKTLAKQTAAVIACSLALGAIIALVDALLQYLIDFIVA